MTMSLRFSEKRKEKRKSNQHAKTCDDVTFHELSISNIWANKQKGQIKENLKSSFYRRHGTRYYYIHLLLRRVNTYKILVPAGQEKIAENNSCLCLRLFELTTHYIQPLRLELTVHTQVYTYPDTPSYTHLALVM